MQERHHVKTTPGEPFAVPEYTEHPIRKEEGGNVQMDDINIPIVAVAVAFFAVLLAVTIVSLQAGFYHYQASERQAKMLAQDDPGDAHHVGTELGILLKKQRDELRDPPGLARAPEVPATAPATGPKPPTATAVARTKRIPIDAAMTIVEKEYAAGRGK